MWPDEDKIRQLQKLADLAYHNGLDPADYPLDAVQHLLDTPEPLSDFDAAGTVRSFEDIYGRDAILLKAMAEPPRLDLL